MFSQPLIDAIAENAPHLAARKDNTFANRLHESVGGDEKKARAKPAKDAQAKASPEPAPPTRTAGAPAAEPAEEGPLARGLKKLFRR